MYNSINEVQKPCFFSYILDVWIIYNKIRTIKHHLSAHKLCVCVFVKKNEVQVRPYEYRESQVIFFFLGRSTNTEQFGFNSYYGAQHSEI